MGESVKSGKTCSGGILQQIFKEINDFTANLSTENLMSKLPFYLEMYPIEGMGFDLRELMFHVIRIHGSYLFLRRSSENFDDFDELIDTGFSRE
jgi:hypothetical protein